MAGKMRYVFVMPCGNPIVGRWEEPDSITNSFLDAMKTKQPWGFYTEQNFLVTIGAEALQQGIVVLETDSGKE